ncbi:ras-related and estrogen-regulated growth inhibitor-like [Tubulanus polymorphus]|uniref:ras-related and estrogen-regulated growth inhibitor-like n=1 Tax=Tubulanus polymorphus TaxID=672921 RepID=UPI003DA666A9
MNSTSHSNQTGSDSSSASRPILRRKRSSFSDVLKIVVVGTTGVGKSALTVRFLTKRFIGEYDPTIENKYRHNTVIDNENVLLELIDTVSESPDDGTLKEDHIRWGDSFVIVYSITNRRSFELVADYRRKICEIKKTTNPLPTLIIGNMSDMGHARQVDKSEGEKLASDFGCLFAETSASDSLESVNTAFCDLCRDAIATKRRSRTFLDRVFGLSYKK